MPKIYRPKEIVQVNYSKQRAHKKTLFPSYTHTHIKTRKQRINYCSSGVVFAGVMGVASSVTSATVVAYSITFSAVVSEGLSDRSSFPTSPITKPERSKLR